MRIGHISALLVIAALAGCPGKGKLPGAGGLGGGKIPGGGNIPGVGGPSALDPNACGGYATSDAGRKLKAFLVATKDVETATVQTIDIVKESCVIAGMELGMVEDDLRKGEAKDTCAKVYGVIDENLKVAIKSKAAYKVKIKPAVCRVSADASVQAAAQCEAKASADFKVSCSGTCNGKCDGACSAKGANGECAGECKGTCSGKCEGAADVNASAQCKASASVKATVEMECTEPEFSIEGDVKLYVDKAKAEATLKALKASIPKMLSVKARLVPLKHAVETWAKSAAELKDSGMGFVQAFKDQATCVGGQIAAAAGMVANIQANVSVSVEFSAKASGSVGSN
jgi:hypothetical protein